MSPLSMWSSIVDTFKPGFLSFRALRMNPLVSARGGDSVAPIGAECGAYRVDA